MTLERACELAIAVAVAAEEPAWVWWAGADNEYFQMGPHATRDDAIADGRATLCGEAFYIVEALPGEVRLNAARLIGDQYFEDNEGFDHDHAEPDRIGDVAAADDELQALLDGWLERWRHTFVVPNLFRASRGEEYVPGECPDCGGDCGDNCPADPDYRPEGVE